MSKQYQLDLLRKERINAVSAYEFDRAALIDRQISVLQEELTKDSFASTSGMRELELSEEKEKIMKKSAEESAKLLQSRVEIQKRFHGRYKTLQAEHTEQLTELARQHAMALEKQTTRPIPEVDALLLQSKILGKERAYSEAKELYREAMGIKNSIIDERRVECNKEYEKLRNKLIERQEREINLLVEKQNSCIQELTKKHEQQKEVFKNTLKVKELKTRSSLTPRRTSATSSRVSSRLSNGSLY